MRKFSLIACVAGLLAVPSFAQPRDLFAEFEAETEATQSSEATATAQSSSSEQSSSSSVAVVVSSSSEALSSSEQSSSSIALSSSSIAVPDSLQQSSSSVLADSLQLSSSSVVPQDSLSSSSEVSSSSEESSSSEVSSSSQVSSSSMEVAQAPSSSSMSRRDLLGPVKVSKVHSIDEMKGKYRSPRKALFMSLVIPGSGQLYVGGSTFNYARGAAYLALEAALWGGWYYFTIYKYDKQVDKYKKFAKNHFSIGRYEAQMRDIYLNQLSDETEESRFETRYMSSREDFCKAIYGDAKASNCYVKGKLFTNDKAHTDRFSVSNPSNLGTEIKNQKNFYDKSTVYQLVSEKSYVLGWDDVDSVALGQNLLLEEASVESIVPLGKSKNLSKYRDMRDKANDYADLQVWFFGGIILNHLVSAIDAAFAANAHNKELYSEDVSWYDRLHFESYMSFLEGFDVGVQASWGF
ncbi:MAG: hypothetical protein IKS02_01565 [Fibrobacter sp.]|nr:hypothetical protein [Fibrobacter sp.]